MSSVNIQQLTTIQNNILSNIEQIKKLVEETQELQKTIDSLPSDKKSTVEKHIHIITEIIRKLTEQTLEMFEAFREFVK